MKYLKKFLAWEHKQMKNPEIILAIWIVFGFMFGIGINNIGAGIAVGIAIGVALYTQSKKPNHKKSLDEEGSQNSE